MRTIVASAILTASFATASLEAHDVSAAQAAAFAFSPTVTQPKRAPSSVSATHVWSVGSQLTYRAQVDEIPVGDAQKPLGLVVTYGYSKLPVDPSRPVVFLFNGGPGAASWSLHMEGFGPVRYDPVSNGFVDNPDSLIDTADLVFIDPVGTGFSAPFSGEPTESLWGADGDATATWQAVTAWLKAHGRSDAPVYLAGESYGGARVATMLHEVSAHRTVNLKGAVLLSPALGGAITSDDPGGIAPEHHSLDARVTDDGTLARLPPPYNDPGMTLGKRPATLMARYVTALGYRPATAYRMLNLTINRTWDYGGPPPQWPFAGYVRDAMASMPGLRLFTAGGTYDQVAPAITTQRTLQRLGIPNDRWSEHVYDAGHTIGEDSVQRPILAGDLRRFIGSH